MTIEDLNHLMKHPEELNAETLAPISKLVQLYPYAHSLVFLYLYNLALLQDVQYYSELDKWAFLLPNREKLFELVELKTPFSALVEEPKSSAVDGTLELIDKFLENALESDESLETELLLDSYFAHSAASDYLSSLEEAPKLEDVAPLLTPSEAVPAAPLSVEKPDPQDTRADESAEPIFTETLAGIYIKQGHYEKAWQIIDSLRLKYPQKSSYFAVQLDFLSKLIENQNFTTQQ